MSEVSADVKYRLDSHRERIKTLEDRTANVNVHEREIQNLWRSVEGLIEEVKSLRRALYTAALSFAGGSLLIAAALVQVLG